MLKKALKKVYLEMIDPLPIHQATIDFKPNLYVKTLRWISRSLIFVLWATWKKQIQ